MATPAHVMRSPLHERAGRTRQRKGGNLVEIGWNNEAMPPVWHEAWLAHTYDGEPASLSSGQASCARSSRVPPPFMSAVDLDFSDVLLRLLAAAAAGGLVGMNRDLADKPIGVPTLGLVSLGAATVSVAGIQVHGMAENADALSRVVQGVIQGVMAGVSFIGAGVILRDIASRSVEGLTTSATVWVSAALGIACGLGAWRTIAIAVPVTLTLLFASGWIDKSKRGGETGRAGIRHG